MDRFKKNKKTKQENKLLKIILYEKKIRKKLKT